MSAFFFIFFKGHLLLDNIPHIYHHRKMDLGTLRKQLHFESGSELEVIIQDDRLIIAQQESTIESAFGICKADVTVSLKDMESLAKD